MTIREFTSLIKNTLNNVSSDSNLSEEYIYWVGVSVAKLILKREADSRKIFKNTTLFSKLSCVDLKEVDKSECGVNLPCNKIMRSKKKLPEMFLTNFGSLIQVFNLTRDLDYKETSVTQYKNISNQRYKTRDSKYFWIENDYLYIPDSNVEKVVVLGLFSSPEEVYEFNENLGECKSILDMNFPCPDYLITPVIESTINQVSTNLKINKDEDSNLNTLDKT